MTSDRWSDAKDQSGQQVTITDGPFSGFEGIIEKVDWQRSKVRVQVSFFGRETPVELDFGQVKKLEVGRNKDN